MHQHTQLSRRTVMQSGSTLLGGALLAGGFGPAMASTGTRTMSSFGTDATALQKAFDWSHETGQAIVLDTEVIVNRTVQFGNLKMVNGGGQIVVLADENFFVDLQMGRWSKQSAIVTRSNPGAITNGDPETTQYIVTIEGNCRFLFYRTFNGTPTYPIRFNGLAPGSRIYLDYYGMGTDGLECNGPDWYYYNRCRIGGLYRLDQAAPKVPGGFWFRDISLSKTGPAYYSDFYFDNPHFVKVSGNDECVAIYNTFIAPGYLRAQGSLTVDYSDGIGFSVLNNAKATPDQFVVTLDQINVKARARGGQGVVKLKGSRISIQNLNCVLLGVIQEKGPTALLMCQKNDPDEPAPEITHASLRADPSIAQRPDLFIQQRGESRISNLAP